MKIDTQLLRNPDIFPTGEVIAQGLKNANTVYVKFLGALKEQDISLMEWRYYNDRKAWLSKGEYKWITQRGANNKYENRYAEKVRLHARIRRRKHRRRTLNILNSGSSTIKPKRFITKAVKKLKGLDDRAAQRLRKRLKALTINLTNACFFDKIKS